MWNLIRSNLAAIVLCWFAATPVLATDFYVDAVNGNNVNAGTSPATAWRNLSFASFAAPSGSAHTIHVAPGIYSSANGENFPLAFEGQHLVGDAGSAATILDGGGASNIVRFYNTPSPKWLASMRGFTCRNAVRPVQVGWSGLPLTATVEDLVLENANAGISLSDGFPGGTYYFTVSRCRFVNCFYGLWAQALTSASDTLTVSDSEFQGPSNFGVYLLATRPFNVRLDRCRISGASEAGVRVAPQGGYQITLEMSDCLLASNAVGYQWYMHQGLVATTFTRCTIASNTFEGVGVMNASTWPGTHTLNESLVWGNGVDYAVPGTPITSFTQIGGPNPLFRDPANGDFRVNFGSPVIDAGDPATAVGTLDLNDFARSVDGDLDTVERADIGCHEFRTLDIDTTGQQGTVLGLEIFGAAGGSSSMRLGRGAFGAPVATAFGEFDMSTIANFPWVTFPVAPGPGFLFQRTIPTAPIFIGQTYSFQGLVTSSTSPSGAAWSNAVSFTIVP